MHDEQAMHTLKAFFFISSVHTQDNKNLAVKDPP